MHPKVSVLVITYNQVDFINETITSVLEQDYPNFEFIIADDGSTDGTAQIISEYAARYPHIIVPLIELPNVGITGNSNRGLESCSGKYVAIMGGDDLFLPGKLTAQVKWLEQNENRILCYHDMEVFDSVTNQTLYYQSRMVDFHQGSPLKIIKHGAFFGATTVMFRKAFPPVFFDNRISVASDWLYWFEIAEVQGGTIGYIDGVYARYRKHTRNITQIGEHGMKDNLLTLDIICEKYPQYKDITRLKKSELYFYNAYVSLSKLQVKLAVLLLLKSCKYKLNLFKTALVFMRMKKNRRKNLKIKISRFPNC